MEYNEKTGEYDPIKVFLPSLNLVDEFDEVGCDVLVWAFHKAPPWAKQLSINGGDEDWLAICTVKFWNEQNQYIPWIDRMGASDVDVFEVDGKFMVLLVHTLK